MEGSLVEISYKLWDKETDSKQGNIPARELLGEMLLEMNKPSLALEAFELDLKKNPNRRNGLYGAAIAASGRKNR